MYIYIYILILHVYYRYTYIPFLSHVYSCDKAFDSVSHMCSYQRALAATWS